MGSNITFNGACPAPFHDVSTFPTEGGYTQGRVCAASPELPGNPTCCMPCPLTEWAYPDSFETWNTVAAWLNVVGLILILTMLLSYTVLPLSKSRGHYLSICLGVAVVFIQLGFVVPLGAKPDQCFNEITPNDMYSSMPCAWSGAFILAGGLCTAMWIMIRALSMHLQICWDIVPGSKFFYISQALGWGVPAALFTASISVSGVSFRFGSACHVNHYKSMQTFWGWLLAFAGIAIILQVSTFGYCIHVFVSNLWSDDRSLSVDSHAESVGSYPATIRAQTAKAIYRRLKSVLYLQWRGILLVTIMLVDIIFFTIVFVYLDDVESSLLSKFEKVEPWLICLVKTQGDRNACSSLSEGWLVKEPTVAAVLIMLSLIGIEVFLLLFRLSFITTWKDYILSKLGHREDFVSLDAIQKPPRPGPGGMYQQKSRTYGANGVSFEMQHKPNPRVLDLDCKHLSPTSSPATSPPTDHPRSFFTPPPQQPYYKDAEAGTGAGGGGDYFSVNTTQPSRTYSGFSSPSPPPPPPPPVKQSVRFSTLVDPAKSLGWDPRSTYAPAHVFGDNKASGPPPPPGQAL